VLESCMTWPFNFKLIFRLWAFFHFIFGDQCRPTGANPSGVFPLTHWPSDFCTSLAVISLSTMYPATWSMAFLWDEFPFFANHKCQFCLKINFVRDDRHLDRTIRSIQGSNKLVKMMGLVGGSTFCSRQWSI